MKKFVLLVTAVAAMAMVTSCTKKVSPKADLKNAIDSLSYAGGMVRTEGLLNYLAQQGVDSTVMADFERGLREGAAIDKDDKKKLAYLSGLNMGVSSSFQFEAYNNQIFAGDSTQSLSKSNFVAGIFEGLFSKNPKMTMDSSQTYATAKSADIRQKALEQQYGENKEAGIKFLEENTTKEGVVTLPNGLQYKVITEGKGAIPTRDDKVKVHYKGTLIDGTEFDSSYSRNEPAIFQASQVIPGWTEALTMMPVGSKWELYIPQNLAYREQNRGLIKPFSTLVFEVELISIEK